jgi:putative Mg2+ transporter-C (MgtC) family protein
VEHFPATAEKVMAGIVTGVSFLGADMIFRDGDTMRGLTSAVALWDTAGVGMLAGIGEYLMRALIEPWRLPLAMTTARLCAL